MKIIITTLDNLPEYCWNCPCCSSVGRCRADEERRKTSEYRPFWCPLSEEKEEEEESEESVQSKDEEPIGLLCNRCGKIVERASLTTIVKIAHGGTSTVNYPHSGEFRICKDCERWLLDEIYYQLLRRNEK